MLKLLLSTLTHRYEDQLAKATVNTTVPLMTTKEEQSEAVKRSLAKAMIEERYPNESWIHFYTDGSAKDAVKYGGTGVHIIFPNGKIVDEAIQTGEYCSNYKTEVEVIIHAAHTIRNRVDENIQVVILSDTFSVLQGF